MRNSYRLSERCNELVPSHRQLNRAGIHGIPEEWRVEFVLMNGMHEAGVLLPLTVLAGGIGLDDYADHVTAGFHPDSGKEQQRRTETSYIQLFGELAAAKP
jgi:hypothetical protein